MRNLLLTLTIIVATTVHSQNNVKSNFKTVSNSKKILNKNFSKKIQTVHRSDIISYRLSKLINETSGLLLYDNSLWTHNDDHDQNLYRLDTLGTIINTIKIPTIKNTDWEEIQQDDHYLYIADIGNNAAGNRKDLHILKIRKNTLEDIRPEVDSIYFSYEKQNDYTPQPSNTTSFDCEAFLVMKDSIYLFTKDWKNTSTSIFVIPNATGTHIAKYCSTYSTEGLITGATVLPDQSAVVLCGYTKLGRPFLLLLTDFIGTNFFSGNIQRIKLPLLLHQIEGITTSNGKIFYLSNEALIRKPFINVPQQLHKIDLSKYFSFP